MQVKKNELVYEEMFPFRKDGNMVQPDSELCKECGGNCCHNAVSLYPRDFERGKEVISIIKLLKMELIELYIDEIVEIDSIDEDSIDVYTSKSVDTGKCIFSCIWGCIIPADMRPLICKFFGPTLASHQEVTVKYQWQHCGFLQSHYLHNGSMDWRPYKKELLRMGLLKCPNVHTYGSIV